MLVRLTLHWIPSPPLAKYELGHVYISSWAFFPSKVVTKGEFFEYRVGHMKLSTGLAIRIWALGRHSTLPNRFSGVSSTQEFVSQFLSYGNRSDPHFKGKQTVIRNEIMTIAKIVVLYHEINFVYISLYCYIYILHHNTNSLSRITPTFYLTWFRLYLAP